MKKGQTQIIEFVMFFLTAFSLFIAISYIFFARNIQYSSDIANYTAKLTNNIVETFILDSLSCKSCDNITITAKIPPKIADKYYEILLDSSEIKTRFFPVGSLIGSSKIFNLNYTYTFSGSSVSENNKIGIHINNKASPKTIGVN